MPSIEDGPAAIANARRLLDAATPLDVPVLFAEQNPAGLGPTVPELAAPDLTAHKMMFDAVRAPGFPERLPAERALVVAVCEAHVCVLQTVLGLLEQGRQVFVVRDALGTRRAENKETALRRMERHSAEIVTTEMVHRRVWWKRVNSSGQRTPVAPSGIDVIALLNDPVGWFARR